MNFLVLKKKVEHFKTSSGREWEKEITAAGMNTRLRENIDNLSFLVCLFHNRTLQTHENTRILFLLILTLF